MNDFIITDKRKIGKAETKTVIEYVEVDPPKEAEPVKTYSESQPAEKYDIQVYPLTRALCRYRWFLAKQDDIIKELEAKRFV